MPPLISILVPVLGRPQNAEPLVESILAAQTVETQIVFLVSADDQESFDACAATPADAVLVMSWGPGPGDYARKINHGFARTRAPYVFTGADDLRFEHGWDTAAIEAIRGDRSADAFGVCGTNDLGNPMTARGRHATHALVARWYVDDVGATFSDGPGVVYHEGYDHQYVDNELCVAAQERGVWTFTTAPAVEHLHPLWTRPDGCGRKADMDATYIKAMKEGRKDSGKYRQRYRTWSQLRRRGRGGVR